MAVAADPGALSAPSVSLATARAWRDLWFELAGDTPELELTLRLLDVGVRWLEERDPRIPLELAPEERAFLRVVLDLDESEVGADPCQTT